MKKNTVWGIILIVIGVISLAFEGISYTSREKFISVGSLQVTKKKTRTLPLPRIAGGIALGGGIVLLVLGGRKG